MCQNKWFLFRKHHVEAAAWRSSSRGKCHSESFWKLKKKRSFSHVCVTAAGDSVVRETNEMRRRRVLNQSESTLGAWWLCRLRPSSTWVRQHVKRCLRLAYMDERHCRRFWKKTVPPVGAAVVLHLFPSFHPQLQARPAPDFWSAETRRARHLRPPWSRSRVDSSSASCWWRCLSARPGFSWRKASLLPRGRRSSKKKKKTCFQQTHREQTVSETHEREESAEGNLFTFGSCRAGR